MPPQLNGYADSHTVSALVNQDNVIIYGPGKTYEHMDRNTVKNVVTTGAAIGSNLCTLLIYFAGAYNIQLNIPGILGEMLQKGAIPGGAAFFNGTLNVHYHGEGVIYIDSLIAKARIAIRVLNEDRQEGELPGLAQCALVAVELLDAGITGMYTYYSVGMYTGIYDASLDNANDELPLLAALISAPKIPLVGSLQYAAFYYATAMLHLLPANEASRITLSLFGGIVDNIVSVCDIDNFSEVNKKRFIRFYSEDIVKQESAEQFNHLFRMFAGFTNEHLPRLADGVEIDTKANDFLNRVYHLCRDIRQGYQKNQVIKLSPELRWQLFCLYKEIAGTYEACYAPPDNEIPTRWDTFRHKVLPEIVYLVVVSSLVPLFAVAFSEGLGLALVFMTILINLVFGRFASVDFVKSWCGSAKEKIFQSYIHFYDELDRSFNRIFRSFFTMGILSSGTSLKLYLEEIGVLLPLWACVLWAVPTAVGTWFFNLTGFGPIVFKWLFRQPAVQSFLKQEGLTQLQIDELKEKLCQCKTDKDVQETLKQFVADHDMTPMAKDETKNISRSVLQKDEESHRQTTVQDVLKKSDVSTLSRQDIIELHATAELLTESARIEVNNAPAKDCALLLQALESEYAQQSSKPSGVHVVRSSDTVPQQRKGERTQLSAGNETDNTWMKEIPTIIACRKMNSYGEAKRLLFAGSVKIAAMWGTYFGMDKPHSPLGVLAFCAAGFGVDFVSEMISRAKRSVREKGHRDSGKHWSQALLSQLFDAESGFYSAVPTVSGATSQILIGGLLMYWLKEEEINWDWQGGPITPRELFVLHSFVSSLLSSGCVELHNLASTPREPIDFGRLLTSCRDSVFDCVRGTLCPVNHSAQLVSGAELKEELLTHFLK